MPKAFLLKINDFVKLKILIMFFLENFFPPKTLKFSLLSINTHIGLFSVTLKFVIFYDFF